MWKIDANIGAVRKLANAKHYRSDISWSARAVITEILSNIYNFPK